MLGGFFGYTFIIVYHPLVTAVHEVDLHSCDAPIGKCFKEVEMILDSQPWQPKYDFYVAVLSVFYQFGKIDGGIGGKRITCIFRPSFVHDDIRNTELGCEVNVVFIGIHIETRTEIYPIEACVVPPFPTHLSRFDPTVVFKNTRGRQVIHHFVFNQFFVFFRNHHHAPGE